MALESKLPLSSRGGGVEQRSGGSVQPAEDVEAGAAAPVWLQRLSLIVLVIFCLYLGSLLVYLPWWREMWDQNALLLRYPAMHRLLVLGPVRGLVSGLGLLDLWIGLSEVMHYREYRE